jgi:hypothetical protein
MTGEQIKPALCEQLQKALTDSSILKKIHITNSTGDVEDLWGLIGDSPFDIFCDKSEWNNKKGVMPEIIGNMTPDIVLRARASGQNRIIIECKGTTEKPSRYGIADSQFVRYFLWLLTMTESRRGQDIRRAVLLAAPSPWFMSNEISQYWNYLCQTYRPIGSYKRNEGFDITLGEIRWDAISA